MGRTFRKSIPSIYYRGSLRINHYYCQWSGKDHRKNRVRVWVRAYPIRIRSVLVTRSDCNFIPDRRSGLLECLGYGRNRKNNGSDRMFPPQTSSSNSRPRHNCLDENGEVAKESLVDLWLDSTEFDTYKNLSPGAKCAATFYTWHSRNDGLGRFHCDSRWLDRA